MPLCAPLSYTPFMVPLVSVVMPVYQREAGLRRALHSLALQSNRSFEVVVADDGSPSPMEAVAGKFVGVLPIRVIRLTHAGRPSVPRNAALRECRGEWVSFLDSDDDWDVDRMERLLPHLVQGVDVVHHRLRVRYVKAPSLLARFQGSRRGKGFGGKSAIEHLTVVGNTIAMSAATVRKSALSRVGGLDERLPCNDDYDLWLRLALAGMTFRFVDIDLGTYEVGGANLSFSGAKGIAARQVFREKYADVIPPWLWKRMSARLNYLDALAALQSGRQSEGGSVGLSLMDSPGYWLKFNARKGCRIVAQSIREVRP